MFKVTNPLPSKLTLAPKEERTHEIVDNFKHRGVTCVIISIKWGAPVRAITSLHDYHCGYVQTKRKLKYDNWIDKIRADELTFSGRLDGVDGYFLGFDSAHYHNTRRSSSRAEVKKRTIAMCEELIKLKQAKVEK